MDELAIGEKRYISARRAAKEHRYHSDYIGQLIRGGKVKGQKVGRAWYVEEESLLSYFDGEKNTDSTHETSEEISESPKPDIVEEVQKEAVEELPVEEEVVEEIKIEEPTPIVEVVKEELIAEELSHPISVRMVEERHDESAPSIPAKGLIYLTEEKLDELLPQNEEEQDFIQPPKEAPPVRVSKKRVAVSMGVLLGIGLVALGGSILLGEHMSVTVGVVEGQSAAVGYTMQW